MQLTGLDINITRQDIVQNDILDKGSLVMLLIIQRLDVADCDGCHGADAACVFVLTMNKYSVLKAGGAICHRTVGISAETDHIAHIGQLCRRILTHFTNALQIGTGDNRTAGIDDTDCAVHRIFHL